jgi:methyl-accepting chemotaxis protein
MAPVIVQSACGLAIVVAPDATMLIRLLGAAVIGIAILFAICSRLGLNADTRAPKQVAGKATRAQEAATSDMGIVAAHPAALGVPHSGTAQDMQTAMQLFGSAIVEQVDSSVGAVLGENRQMREMAGEMASASAQAKDQFKIAMSRTVEAEDGLEQLTACSGELNGSTQVIGSEVKRSIATVKDATAQAAATRACVETMATLSRAVSGTINVIDDIARQTKMLALNAAIEAARAGDAGAGFAVVANEVKQLASQTADATQMIGGKIEQMTAMVAESVSALQTLVDTIANVDEASGSIGRAIVEQESLAARVASSLESMRSGVFSLSREIREAAQIAANCGMLSELVLETANSVEGLMGGFKKRFDDISAGMAPAGPSK